MPHRLRVVLIKPSKYGTDGVVERFRRGFMPNATLVHLKSMTLAHRGAPMVVETVDEYIETDLGYLDRMAPASGERVLVALVGVQSHQLHRALDVAALANRRGALAILGGPHPMTCDTAELQGRGVSFSLSEAELVWADVLDDAARGELRPVYGSGAARWQTQLESPVLVPPSPRELRRHAAPMMGIYPARGCPFRCSFCSVIKIAGRRVRSEPIETTLASLRAARSAGVKMIMFTSDNFNKHRDAPALLRAMIDEDVRLPFFVQCDTQVAKQEELLALLAEAGCWQMFVGIESLDRATLQSVHKEHNHPDRYADLVRVVREHGIMVHLSSIFGFPNDTESSMRAHLDALVSLDPDTASFHVLTPIPGTEQYDDFKRAGLLYEPNLDRYGGGQLVWRHPHLDRQTLRRYQLMGYRATHSPQVTVRKVVEWRRRAGRVPPFGAPFYAGLMMSSWLSAALGVPPMSGGLWSVTRDGASDYAALRRATWGFDLAPLPDNLPTPADAPISLGRAV